MTQAVPPRCGGTAHEIYLQIKKFPHTWGNLNGYSLKQGYESKITVPCNGDLPIEIINDTQQPRISQGL